MDTGQGRYHKRHQETIFILCLFIFMSVSWGTSSGKDVFQCDATANFGCSKWNIKDGTINRLDCIESPNEIGIMPWAERPIRTDAYSVRSGDSNNRNKDATTYVPNQYMNIFIQVNRYGWTYRGLLLHAVNELNETVGKFVVPPDDNSLFWVPPGCPQAIMHTSADKKPYFVQLRFKAPSNGTGRINFRCLIKRGPANHGSFYYPMINGDLSLTEADVPDFQYQWSVSSSGESCDSHCKSKGKICDLNAISSLNGLQNFYQDIDPFIECNYPLVSGCSAYTPATNPNGLCWYHDNNCASNRNPKTPTCDASSISKENGMRICACADSDSTNAGTQLRYSRFWIGYSLVVFLYLGNSQQKTILMTLFAFLILLVTCDAHNWILTPGRNWGKASTTKPCPGRKATDTHVQVSTRQSFPLMFSVGHTGRWHYVTVVAGRDSKWLENSKYFEMVEDYIQNAPKEAYQTEDHHQRFHRTGIWHLPSDHAGGLKFTPDGLWFEREIKPTDPLYIDHPDVVGGENWKRENAPLPSNWKDWKLFKYFKNKINTDVRVSYKSEKYPWLESAFKFYQHYSLPIDYNVINMSIPARSGPGHYIVHWHWAGYSDCTDVDVRKDDVKHIYGQGTGKFIYNKIDHCSYIHPSVASPKILSKCIHSPEDIAACLAELKDGDHLDGKARYGVQVSPLKLPASVYFGFQNETTIPWDDATCGNTTWTTLSGTDTRSTIDWEYFKSTITKYSGKTCANSCYIGKMTFIEAITQCSESNCAGVAWNNMGVQTLPSKKHTDIFIFQFCCDGAVIQNTSWLTIMKNIPAPIPNNEAFSMKVNFQTSTNDLNLGSEWIIDTGGEYGSDYPNLGWIQCRQEMWYQESTKENTGAWIQHGPSCKPGTIGARAFKEWEVSVPKGLYRVTSYHKQNELKMETDIRIGACHIENVKLISDFNAKGDSGVTVTHEVDVTDGNLTFGHFPGPRHNICNHISYIEIIKIEQERKPSWLPSSSNPWWQRELAELHPIGNIYVTLGCNHCSEWWLFKGYHCPSGQRVWGEFPEEYQGAVVGVSNTSCSGSSICPGIICGKIDKAPNTNDRQRTIYHITCKGIVGKFIYLQLPGNARILPPLTPLNFWIDTHRHYPISPADTMICFALEAAELSPDARTSFEYETTQDPWDPIFYSTCFVREKDVKFEGLQSPLPTPRWRYHRQCLKCENWRDNLENTNISVVQWEIAQKCIACG